MVGIILALQFNDWNEERKNRDLERNFLHRIQRDLQEDLTEFKKQQEAGHRGVEALKEAVTLIHQENKEEDIYKFNQLYDVAAVQALKPQYSTYQELESTGQLNLIREEALRVAIQNHYAIYRQLENHFNSFDEWHTMVTYQFEAETGIMKYVNWNRPIFPHEVLFDRDWAFINDPTHPHFVLTESAVATSSFFVNYALSEYSKIIPQTESLQKKIAETLEALDK